MTNEAKETQLLLIFPVGKSVTWTRMPIRLAVQNAQ